MASWRDKFAVTQASLEPDCEEAARVSRAPNLCGAPAPRSSRYCNRPARHPGDHMVLHYRRGSVPGFRWPQEPWTDE